MGIAATPKPSNLYRALTSIFLINSATFAKAAPTEQTATLLKADGKTILFVGNFVELSNRNRIRDRLISGEDVSMELEFNDIEMTAEDYATLRSVRPILEKINGIKSAYPWLPEVDYSETIICGDVGVKRGEYSMTKDRAKAVWQRLSKYWSGGKSPSDTPIMTSAGSRYLDASKSSLIIGCQSFKRDEIEFIARHYGWEPNVHGS